MAAFVAGRILVRVTYSYILVQSGATRLCKVAYMTIRHDPRVSFASPKLLATSVDLFRALLIFLPLLVAACGIGGGGSGASATTSASITLPTISATHADISLLFMGNSHTSVNNLSVMVTTMAAAGLPGKTVGAIEAPVWKHLQERSTDAASLALLNSQRWSFVILQAQNYSQSGKFNYPTTGAELLVRQARLQGATPVMFPEWARANVDEAQRIFDLHVSIARKEPACVAPIPQAFVLAQSRYPSITLLDRDGNHSARAGAFLAALVLYATIVDRSPNDLPYFPQIDIDANTQRNLRAVANETVQTIPPRLWCAADERPG